MTARLRLSRRHHAIIDAEDLPHVARHTWRLHVPSRTRTRNTHYAVAEIDRKNVYLHLFLWRLWGKPPVPIVDHHDGDGLNCTRLNLRDANVTQNNRNRGALRTNTTGAKGVTWDKKAARYRAKIQVDHKRLHLGYFDKLEDASKAYDDAARVHHGPYAVLNGGIDGRSSKSSGNALRRRVHRTRDAAASVSGPVVAGTRAAVG